MVYLKKELKDLNIVQEIKNSFIGYQIEKILEDSIKVVNLKVIGISSKEIDKVFYIHLVLIKNFIKIRIEDKNIKHIVIVVVFKVKGI